MPFSQISPPSPSPSSTESIRLQVPSSGQCSSSPNGYCGHAVAQKNFKRLLLRTRGTNSFQLSKMHLKGVCWEVDWLFPI